MTKEQKAALLCQEIKDSNVLRYLIRSMFPEIAGAIPEDALDAHLARINAYKATLEYKIEDAMNFGNKLMVEFTTQNILMGITQDGKTSQVRKALAEVIICLSTGSLYDAIAEVKAVPVEKRDSKYLTAARLTAFINKIETYLGITHTEVT